VIDWKDSSPKYL